MTYTGTKCPTSYVTGSEIAKMMRSDIRNAIAAGELPGKISNYSVRTHNYSGGRSINITAKGLEDMWTVCRGTGQMGCNHWPCEGGRPTYILTEKGESVQEALQAIHTSYNYDHGDPMTDYFNSNFYGSAQVERVA